LSSVCSLGLRSDISGFHDLFTVTGLRGSGLDDVSRLTVKIRERHGDLDLKRCNLVDIRQFLITQVSPADSLLACDLARSNNKLVSVHCRDYLCVHVMTRDLLG
jgi:hypothetical protein